MKFITKMKVTKGALTPDKALQNDLRILVIDKTIAAGSEVDVDSVDGRTPPAWPSTSFISFPSLCV